MSKAAKQSYLGRVIFPAKYIASSSGKPFITFTLYVDNHLVAADGNRGSARINCSYSISGEKDPVAMILCRIFNKEDPDAGGLAGEKYKSVEIWVEGNERLSEVQDKPGAVYKSLDFCSVQITDKEMLKLYKAHTSGSQEKEATGAISKNTQAPTQAPTQAATSTTTKKKRKEYSVGEKVESNGKTYEFLGGDSKVLSNWKEVVTVGENEEDDALPFIAPMQRAGKKVANTPSMRTLLEEEGVLEDSPFTATKNLAL